MGFTDEKRLLEKEERCQRLLEEIRTGEIKKDVFLNSSYDFSGEIVAEYFSRTNVFMNSTLGKRIMC